MAPRQRPSGHQHGAGGGGSPKPIKSFEFLLAQTRAEDYKPSPLFMIEQIVILDFGSQYTQVIARRIRECNVYCTILPYKTRAKKIAAMNPKGLVLSGGPSSVYAPKAPHPDKEILDLGIPVLGICYGLQLLAHYLGGKVEPGKKREYGKGALEVKDRSSPLFVTLPAKLQVWNSHGDRLTKLPAGFKSAAVT